MIKHEGYEVERKGKEQSLRERVLKVCARVNDLFVVILFCFVQPVLLLIPCFFAHSSSMSARLERSSTPRRSSRVGVSGSADSLMSLGLMVPQQDRFLWHFFFFAHFLLVFMGMRRTCGHAITPCDIFSALLTVPCCSTDRLHSSRP